MNYSRSLVLWQLVLLGGSVLINHMLIGFSDIQWASILFGLLYLSLTFFLSSAFFSKVGPIYSKRALLVILLFFLMKVLLIIGFMALYFVLISTQYVFSFISVLAFMNTGYFMLLFRIKNHVIR